MVLIVGDDARRGEVHPWLHPVPFAPHVESNRVSDRIAPRVLPAGSDAGELTEGLAGRPRTFGGHDGTDRWRAMKAIVKAAGLDPEVWGICPVCKGHGIHPGDIEAQESFEPTDPPTGEGWQLWETTSEGSPISPVFATPAALAAWAARSATTFADGRWTADQWLASFIAGTTEDDTLFVVRDGEQIAPVPKGSSDR
jgi:hypothetical protein